MLRVPFSNNNLCFYTMVCVYVNTMKTFLLTQSFLYTKPLVTVKFPSYLLDVKLQGVEVCDLLLIQPLLEEFWLPKCLLGTLGLGQGFCRKMIEVIPRRLATVIAKGGEEYVKKTIKPKFDFDKTWIKVVHNINDLKPINCFSHVNIVVQLI